MSVRGEAFFNDAAAARAELDQLVCAASRRLARIRRWLLDRAVVREGHIGGYVRLRGVGRALAKMAEGAPAMAVKMDSIQVGEVLGHA
jgi:hypothetical protein